MAYFVDTQKILHLELGTTDNQCTYYLRETKETGLFLHSFLRRLEEVDSVRKEKNGREVLNKNLIFLILRYILPIFSEIGILLSIGTRI